MVIFPVMSYTQIFRLIIVEKDATSPICIAAEEHLEVFFVLHIYVYQLLLQFFLPTLFIIIGNVGILIKIRSMKVSVSKHGTYHAPNNNKSHKTTFVLLIVSFTYVVTLFPLVLVSMVIHITHAVDKKRAAVLFYKLASVQHVFELLSEVNYGINFFIYVLSGTQFRYELIRILRRNPTSYSRNDIIYSRRSQTSRIKERESQL